ncbi:MAG: hypothetical protein WCC41_07015, partial [Rhodomicrobium sp.]
MMNLNSKVKSFIKNLFASLFIAPAQKCNAEASLAEVQANKRGASGQLKPSVLGLSCEAHEWRSGCARS